MKLAPDALVFGLGEAAPLAEAIAARLGLVRAADEARDFPDGEHKGRPLVSVDGRDTLVVSRLIGAAPPTTDGRLLRLLFFIGALRDGGARRVGVFAPCLPFLRKDRRTKPGDPLTARYVAQLFEAMGADFLATLEAHDLAALENAFRIPVTSVPGAGIFAPHLAPLAARGDLVVVSPDIGGARRAEALRLALEAATGAPVGNAFVEKHRSGGRVTGSLLAGDVAGRTCLVFDDLVATGTTLVRAAARLKAAGASRVIAAATHAILNRDSAHALADPALDRIVTTDSVLPPPAIATALGDRLEILPVPLEMLPFSVG